MAIDCYTAAKHEQTSWFEVMSATGQGRGAEDATVASGLTRFRKRPSRSSHSGFGPLPNEPERSVCAFRPPFFELFSRDFFKLSPIKQIFERAVYERRAFVTVPLLQFNTVASDAPISKYVNSSQHRVCQLINFVEEPDRLPVLPVPPANARDSSRAQQSPSWLKPSRSADTIEIAADGSPWRDYAAALPLLTLAN
jgi:hypothetical protein